MNPGRDIFLPTLTLALALALAFSAPLAGGATEKLVERVVLASTTERQEWIARVEGGARAYQAFAERAYEDFQARQRRAGETSSAPAGDYLSDPTLRRHDIFVTATGFHIFKGSTHFPYRESDFVHLSEGEGKALFLSSGPRP